MPDWRDAPPDLSFGRWALYAPRQEDGPWLLRGIYPSAKAANGHGRMMLPRIVMPVSTRGRPPERFSDFEALERWFGVSDTGGESTSSTPATSGPPPTLRSGPVAELPGPSQPAEEDD